MLGTARLRDRDLLSGVVLIAIGAAALVLGSDLTIGTAAEMGEGYVPRAMAIALVLLGILIAALAWRSASPPPESSPARGEEGPGPEAFTGFPPPQSSPTRGEEALRLRPLVFVTAAILVFAAALEPLGILAAIAGSVTTATFAGEPLRARTVAILIGVLGLAVVAVFVWALGLPLDVLPRLD